MICTSFNRAIRWVLAAATGSIATYQESVSRWLTPFGGSIFNEQAVVFIANQHF
ncbi:hypothetical protein ABN702_12715 [Bacillus haimaensis]|uniref:hypothetical protein n=1 Tax=Bacillus haimaensis TaxID=3160967 RepID=UPI003AA91672